MITEILQHIAAFPGLSAWRIAVDARGGGPYDGGLFCRGLQVVSREGNLLGGCRIRRRLSLTLELNLPREPAEGSPDMAACLGELALWLEGGGPALGLDQTVEAKGGILKATSMGGISVYTMDILYEFTQEVAP